MSRGGKSVRAIRLYEELGLLNPKARSHGGFRLYDDTATTRIRWIELLQSSGFSLHQIQALLSAWHGDYVWDASSVVTAIRSPGRDRGDVFHGWSFAWLASTLSQAS